MSDETRLCNICGEQPVSRPDGLLCADCKALWEERAQDPFGEWYEAERARRASPPPS